MQGLQSEYRDAMALHGGDPLGGGLRGGERGDGGDTLEDSSAADGFFVEDGVLAAGRVDDELDAALFDEIDGVGAALVDFEDALDTEAGGFKGVGGAFGGDDLEAEIDVAARQWHGGLLVVVVDREEDRAAGGQDLRPLRRDRCGLLAPLIRTDSNPIAVRRFDWFRYRNRFTMHSYAADPRAIMATMVHMAKPSYGAV